jgi:N-methylhydantoinase A
VVEAQERVTVDGEVVKGLDHLADLTAGVAALEPQSVAVCFLYSFLRPEHERMVAEALAGALDVPVSISSEILPVFREYERASTTALNAYVAPRMGRYLDGLSRRLAADWLRSGVHVMRSGGGTFDAELAGRLPVHTLLSGPAAGAWGAAAVATGAGFDRVIGFDMGGTSTDVTLIEDGAPNRTAEGSIDGLPFGVATTDIHTIGSGGGSVAWRDDGGALRVGPRSAGAVPGPACYGLGGTDPTVTDAFALLGFLDPAMPLGGSLSLDLPAAASAIGRLAEAMAMVEDATAEGILRIAEAQIARALRVVSIERGKDPRSYALLPFGGAGPLLQGPLSRALGSPVVLVPRAPGVLSAIGLLSAPIAVDLARTKMTELDAPDASGELLAVWRDLERDAGALLAAQGSVAATVTRSADCRYRGQAFELEVPAPRADPTAIGEAFHAEHLERYGYHQREQAVQLVTVRVRAEGPPAAFSLPAVPEGRGADAARIGRRTVRTASTAVECPVYGRDALGRGDRFEGPALVVGVDSTCFVLAGQRGEVDALGTLVLTEA